MSGQGVFGWRPRRLADAQGRNSTARGAPAAPDLEVAMSNPSISKRQREKDRQDKAKEKAVKRQQRRKERDDRAPAEPGVDPDIAHIIPGPQPPLEDLGDTSAGKHFPKQTLRTDCSPRPKRQSPLHSSIE
jgi:hypothetical protein